MRSWFEVDRRGYSDLMKGKEPWRLFLEPVSNALDAEAKNVNVTIGRKARSPFVEFTCEDDGEGFTDIRLAYTFYANTDRRTNPRKRGRFTVGEKSFLSICEEGMIETGDKRVTFDDKKGRHTGSLRNPRVGCLVRALVKLDSTQEKSLSDRLKDIIVPDGVHLAINAIPVAQRHSHKSFHAILHSPTELADGSLRTKARETEVRLYDPHDSAGEPQVAHLYELGIPVQPLECPYHVNIMQKIPLAQERDMVSDKFLQTVYAEVLNAVIDELGADNSSDTWVRIAVSNPHCRNDTVAKVRDKRFGEKAVLWSSDTEANEKALAEGYQIIHPRTLSEEERSRFEQIGLKHSTQLFGRTEIFGANALANRVEPNEDMTRVAEYAKTLARELIAKDITVSFFKQFENPAAAEYGGGTLSFNICRLGYDWFKQGKTPQVTALIVHELAHEASDPDYAHGHVYVNRLAKLAGMLPFLATKKPQLFT